jgi:hypothetical protein
MEKSANPSHSLPAPGSSGSFRISLKSPTPTDPGGRLAELASSTQALRVRLASHERYNSHLDEVVRRITGKSEKERNGKKR